MAQTKTTLESPTGATLNLYVWKAASRPRGVVQINHGMAEHAARYAGFAQYLNGRGYHVYAHDHRGHGHTSAPDAPLGTYARDNGWQLVLEDILFVNTTITHSHPGLPVLCFGHSMGATIATAYAQAYPETVQALAAWNGGEPGMATLALTFLLKVERLLKGSDVPSQWAAKLTFESFNKAAGIDSPRTPFDWLSREEAEVDAYVADPLCGFTVSNRLWLDFLDGLKNTTKSSAIAALPKTLPIHLLGGEKDPCSSFARATQKFAKQLIDAGHSHIKLEILPDTRHESLNEINRESTMQNFARWLDENLKPSPL